MADLDPRRMLGMVGEQPFAPPPPRLPDDHELVPAPRRADLSAWVVAGADCVDLTDAPPGPARLLAEELARLEVRVGGPGFPVTFTVHAGNDPSESYRLRSGATGVAIEAPALAGLARAAATARQLLRRRSGRLEVRTAEIEDGPVVPLRMLAGWGLYRDHRMEWALDMAAEGKFNRVLYNWWAATPEERMGSRERDLVARARDVGVELVVELRRQALGPDFSFRDRSAVAPLLRHYDDALEHGFRSFGFLFDDTDHDPFDDELRLLGDLVAHLTDRLGSEPEFFFCPRFYWFPGQMDYSWLATLLGDEAADGGPSMAPMLGGTGVRALGEAVARQEDYQRRLAAALPDRTEVYLANWWSGTPGDWKAQLASGWTGRVGRQPVFWDNQQQNDFRAAVVLPVPLHQRPAGFAYAIRGYTLNSGVPLSAYASTSVTAGAWAWNPDAYDAASTWGAALTRLYGDAAAAVAEALSAWGDLLGELMAPRIGPEHHYGGLRAAVERGEGQGLADRLDAIEAVLAGARARVAPTAPAWASNGLGELASEVQRLRLDLALAACTDPDEAERLVEAITGHLVRRLPPVAELHALAAGAEMPGTPVPGISWYLHFVAGPLRTGPRRLQRRVTRSS